MTFYTCGKASLCSGPYACKRSNINVEGISLTSPGLESIILNISLYIMSYLYHPEPTILNHDLNMLRVNQASTRFQYSPSDLKNLSRGFKRSTDLLYGKSMVWIADALAPKTLKGRAKLTVWTWKPAFSPVLMIAVLVSLGSPMIRSVLESARKR